MRRRVLAPKYKKAKAPGKELEGHIEKNLKQLKSLGTLQYIKLKVDKGRSKEPADFLVKTPKGLWLFDAKECGAKYFYFTKKTMAHQIKAAREWQAVGTKTGFVIWFTEADPCKNNLRFVTEFDKPADIMSGVRFEFSMMAQ